MFILNLKETVTLVCQIGIPSKSFFDAIKALVAVPETKKINIGFLGDRDK